MSGPAGAMIACSRGNLKVLFPIVGARRELPTLLFMERDFAGQSGRAIMKYGFDRRVELLFGEDCDERLFVTFAADHGMGCCLFHHPAELHRGDTRRR